MSQLVALTAALAAGACQPTTAESGADAGPTDGGVDQACPTHIELESLGDLTRIDVGFSGLAHGTRLPSNTFATYRLSDCDQECRRCKFSGPVASDPGRRPTSFQRCVNDPTIACESDGDCGGGACRWQLRSTQINAANQCSGAYFEPVPGFGDGEPLQGTIDLITGAASLSIANLRLTTYGAGPCQTCEGDTTAFDGRADGVCSETGEACDVSGTGGGGNTPAFVTSFDCPTPGSVVSDSPLPLTNLGSASQTWTLDATRPDCTGTGVEDESCWCGVCEDFTPCFDDSQCASGTCGFSGTTDNPVSSFNNLCDDQCQFDEATSSGSCTSSAFGAPMTVPCFPRSGSITVAGGVEVGDGFFITTLAGLGCFPATFTSRDQVFGLPGIIFVQNVYRITPLRIP